MKVLSMKAKRRTLALGAAMALALLAGPAQAQTYPHKPVTIVVAYPAGGDTDALARLLGEKLSARIGQSVLVDNRAGASGTIGSSFVAKAPADGYTLLLAPNTFAMAQLVLKLGAGHGYDVLNGFTPVIEVGSTSLFLVAGPGAGVRSFKEAISSSQGRSLGYATPGNGSPMHFLGEMVRRATGARFEAIPYKGVAPAVTDVVGGHVPFTYSTLGSIAPYLPGGKLVALAVADAQRSPLAPDVPTLAELGYKDVELTAWYGLFGPRNMPAEVVKLLNTRLNEILRMPDVVARMATLGTVPVGGPPQRLGKTNAGDFERFGRLVKELGIQPD